MQVCLGIEGRVGRKVWVGRPVRDNLGVLGRLCSDDGIIKLPSVMETCGKKQCPGCPSDAPLDDYRLFHYAKTGVISYIKNTKVGGSRTCCTYLFRSANLWWA